MDSERYKMWWQYDGTADKWVLWIQPEFCYAGIFLMEEA